MRSVVSEADGANSGGSAEAVGKLKAALERAGVEFTNGKKAGGTS